ncbi:Segregation and condensation protein B [bioreactor metagenome]|uniref:Segregation and condensation protein B n=1 Tax=bioreactor metagenome TaxID=1076179 RepID=A0A645BLE8_9ZZZZ
MDSSYTVGLLLERELIEESGRLQVPGRPILYKTTKNFLRTFHLSSLDELPELPLGSDQSGQFTLEMQSAAEKLREEAAQDAEEVGEGSGELLAFGKESS